MIGILNYDWEFIDQLQIELSPIFNVSKDYNQVFLLFIYFTEQSEMQDICKLSEESDAEKEKWEKYIFFLLVSSRFDFPNQKSKVESLSGGNNRSWKSTRAAMKFQ